MLIKTRQKHTTITTAIESVTSDILKLSTFLFIIDQVILSNLQKQL